LQLNFQVINQTGMTDVSMVLLSPKGDGFPIEGDWMAYSQAPGNYTQSVKFTYDSLFHLTRVVLQILMIASI